MHSHDWRVDWHAETAAHTPHGIEEILGNAHQILRRDDHPAVLLQRNWAHLLKIRIIYWTLGQTKYQRPSFDQFHACKNALLTYFLPLIDCCHCHVRRNFEIFITYINKVTPFSKITLTLLSSRDQSAFTESKAISRLSPPSSFSPWNCRPRISTRSWLTSTSQLWNSWCASLSSLEQDLAIHHHLITTIKITNAILLVTCPHFMHEPLYALIQACCEKIQIEINKYKQSVRCCLHRAHK